MHLVEVRVYDMSGNFAKASVNFTVDTVDPLVTITSPSGTLYSNSSSVQFNWTGSDPTSGIKGFSYLLDEGEWSQLSEPSRSCSSDCPRDPYRLRKGVR